MNYCCSIKYEGGVGSGSLGIIRCGCCSSELVRKMRNTHTFCIVYILTLYFSGSININIHKPNDTPNDNAYSAKGQLRVHFSQNITEDSIDCIPIAEKAVVIVV